MFTKIASFALAVILTGCTLNAARVTADGPLPKNAESVIVLGVSPAAYTVVAFPGEVTNGTFRQNPWKNAVVHASSVDGYVIAKVTGGDTVALMRTYRIEKDGSGVPFSAVGACDGAKTLVFEVPMGKVLYIGDVKYEPSGRQVSVQYGQNLEEARKHVDQHYPALKGRLEPWKYELLPTTTPCSSTMTIPIYLPSKR